MFKQDIPARTINEAFVDKIQRGFVKEAAQSASSLIKQYVREESFLSKIMTEIPIDGSELDKDENLDTLKKIVEIEPNCTATWVTFKGTPPMRYIKQEAVPIYFGVIVTDELVKNIFELKTRDNDIRKILAETQAKEILREQDGRFIQTCEAIVADNGQVRNFVGGLTKNNFAEALKILPSIAYPRTLQTGCVLMNYATAMELLKWDSNDVGFEIATEHYRKGLVEGTIMGIKLLCTIKNDIVPNNVVWIFPKEEYLGKFFVLQDSTVYMESKGLFISFYTYKCLGIGIVNTTGIWKCVFNP